MRFLGTMVGMEEGTTEQVSAAATEDATEEATEQATEATEVTEAMVTGSRQCLSCPTLASCWLPGPPVEPSGPPAGLGAHLLTLGPTWRPWGPPAGLGAHMLALGPTCWL
ncbi:hypothetical protein OTU49_005113 [Cherax quadricarinatus]|uniref:Uncharacterized protein n=1 Tax=Cherax quadricarinatus TaxID=27406 RepID=A0AAW0WY73_CHEQU